MRISNAGNQPITPSDFVRSLTISLNAEANILSAVVVETQPSNLTAELNFKGNTVEVIPLLLNPKDSFKVKLLASGYKSGPIADARINGVSKISEVRERRGLYPVLLGMGLLFLVAAAWLLPKPSKPEPSVPLQETILFFLLITISAICIIWAYVKMLMRDLLGDKRAKKGG